MWTKLIFVENRSQKNTLMVPQQNFRTGPKAEGEAANALYDAKWANLSLAYNKESPGDVTLRRAIAELCNEGVPSELGEDEERKRQYEADAQGLLDNYRFPLTAQNVNVVAPQEG